MARTIVWTKDADEDLASIKEYISRDSEFYAKAVTRRIFTIVDSLIEFPFSGRVVLGVDALDANLREKVVYSYRVVYRVKDDSITVVSITHCRQKFDPKMRDKLDKD